MISVFFPSDFNDNAKIKEYGDKPTCYWEPRSEHLFETTFSHKTYPVSSLKLEKIYLFENETLSKKVFLNALTTETLKKQSELLNFQIKVTTRSTITNTSYKCKDEDSVDRSPCPCEYDGHVITSLDDGRGTEYIPLHLSDNVIEAADLASMEPRFTNNALRVIDFNTDYSLMKYTLNSFDDPNLYTVSPPGHYDLQGRLTLNSIAFRGMGGKNLLPPITFDYEPDNLEEGNAELIADGSPLLFRFHDATGKIKPGDILKLSDGSNSYHAVVTSVDGLVKLKMISPEGPAESAITWQVTKNPPYNKDSYDIWGLYKSDYDQSLVNLNEGYGRMVTEVSSMGLDVWSLHSINTMTGAKIKINYEPDDYYSVYFDESNLMWIKNIERDLQAPDYLDVYFDERFNPGNHFAVGQMADIICLLGFTANTVNGDPKHNGVVYSPFENPIIGVGYTNAHNKSEIKSINGSSMRIYNSSLYKAMTPFPDTPSFSHDFLSGTILTPDKSEKLGGGLRVNSIVVSSETHTSKTSYLYSTPDNKSSGVSSYYPLSGASAAFFFPDNKFYRDEEVLKIDRRDFNTAVNQRLLDILTISRQLPPPGVMYSQVTVEEYFLDENGTGWRKIPNYSEYNYEVFNKGMVGINYSAVNDESYSAQSYNDQLNHNRKRSRTVVLKDYTSQVGSLKKVALYDEAKNPLSETINHYLHDGVVDELRNSGYDGDNIEYDANQNILENRIAFFNNQGVIEETFSDAKFVKYNSGSPLFVLQGVVTKREQFPSIKTGQTVINNKSGIVTKVNNIGFDFYSGQVVKSTSADSYGNRFMTEQTPAFRKYPEMQSAAKGGANMLTQNTASYTFRVDGDDHPVGLVSASVQTWSNKVPVLGLQNGESNVWRPHAIYQWNGSENIDPNTGIYPIADFGSHPFNWHGITQSESWERILELTLYDTYSHDLEANDITGNYFCARTSPDQTRIIANASNSKYNEMGFSGAEYYAANLEKEGGIDRGEGNPSTAHAHTGKYSLLVGFNSKGFNFKIEGAKKGKKYKASAWVYVPGEGEIQSELDKVELYYSANNVVKKSVHPVLQKNKSKSWYLLSIDIIAGEDSDVMVSCSNASVRGVYFDDFRVHPMEASFTAYVYEPNTGKLSHILDKNNFYTKFEYDEMGRLVRASKELLNFDFGVGKESFRADRVINEVKYNHHKD